LAVKIARKLAEADPDDPFGLARLSWSLDELDCVQEAHDLLARAVKKYPTDYRLRYSLARYCSKLGKLKEAMHHWETAIDYGLRESTTYENELLMIPLSNRFGQTSVRYEL
jgi:tetratricopeptide (TPR) repeat protein